MTWSGYGRRGFQSACAGGGCWLLLLVLVPVLVVLVVLVVLGVVLVLQQR